ncbi:hypothetical protein AVEN_242989-1 [Araneus ventricosus]|uniref:Mariner Mos1 transposase n=1 Tax=Araneus ventricosus TaxID=182803 RepID=A0A4Y2D4R3_ARAVE|nr:hypothetical protein AVEN_242989-1 [Araneus ventricosus]
MHGVRVVNMHHRKTLVNAGLNDLGNGYGKKRILRILWDQEHVVYHELLNSSKTVNSSRRQQQIVDLNLTLIVKRPQRAIRHYKVILFPDNASLHKSKPGNKSVKRFCL